MNRVERLMLWIALVAALCALLGGMPTRVAAAERADDDAEDAPFAVCAIWDLTEELAQSPRYAEPRAQRLAALLTPEQAAVKARYERLDKITDELDPSDPNAEATWAEWEEVAEQYWAIERSVEEQRSKIELDDYAAAMATVIEAAEAIAEDHGHSCVVSTIVPIKHRSKPMTAMWELWELMKFQAAAVYPKSADITDDVRSDLNLE